MSRRVTVFDEAMDAVVATWRSATGEGTAAGTFRLLRDNDFPFSGFDVEQGALARGLSAGEATRVRHIAQAALARMEDRSGPSSVDESHIGRWWSAAGRACPRCGNVSWGSEVWLVEREGVRVTVNRRAGRRDPVPWRCEYCSLELAPHRPLTRALDEFVREIGR